MNNRDIIHDDIASGTFHNDTMQNGIRVITNRVSHVQSVTLGIWINAGSREDPDTTPGLAHFVEHAIFKGTSSRDYETIARCIEDVGGYIDAWTTKENTCIYIRCLKEHIALAFSLLSDLCCNPSFPDEEIEKEKEVVIEEIHSINDAPEELIFDEFDLHAFPHHRLGSTILGTEESIESITGDDLRQFMQNNYTPDNLLVTAVGNVTHTEIMELAVRSFASLQEGTPAKRSTREFELRDYTPFNLQLQKPVYQAQLLFGTAATRKNEHFYSLLLLNTILGSGMSSRMNLELREKNALAYNVYSSLTLFDDATMFNVYAGTDNSNIVKALAIIDQILSPESLCSIDQSELETAKSRLLGAMIMGMEKMTRRMSRAARDLFYFGRIIPLEEKINAIRQVTQNDIRHAVMHLLQSAPASTLIYEAEEE
ncbi:peptidase M16 [Prosthecochloris sp. ZM]|uniref:M16 family metallopeptidase n=1 Tax=Prosthecochloris sp. ZM TaxID=2283143 RepID=UPI000DF809DC|nr:pitrilysin family protein [Prosthecochloris sp. ZM]RDD31488.1 peptidase M16 [Prosthecochloris sp. ZM]